MEEHIRAKLLKIATSTPSSGLPTNLFYSTGIPVCILVLKKCTKPDDMLFINAAESFVKGKRQNQLSEELSHNAFLLVIAKADVFIGGYLQNFRE